jgi:hypothetical protein
MDARGSSKSRSPIRTGRSSNRFEAFCSFVAELGMGIGARPKPALAAVARLPSPRPQSPATFDSARPAIFENRPGLGVAGLELPFKPR